MLFVLFGLAPGTDVVAHFGGFVSGLVLGALLMRSQAVTHSGMANLVSGLGFALLVIIPWWLALSSSGI
jgi:hypothetical protein